MSEQDQSTMASMFDKLIEKQTNILGQLVEKQTSILERFVEKQMTMMQRIVDTTCYDVVISDANQSKAGKVMGPDFRIKKIEDIFPINSRFEDLKPLCWDKKNEENNIAPLQVWLYNNIGNLSSSFDKLDCGAVLSQYRATFSTNQDYLKSNKTFATVLKDISQSLFGGLTSTVKKQDLVKELCSSFFSEEELTDYCNICKPSLREEENEEEEESKEEENEEEEEKKDTDMTEEEEEEETKEIILKRKHDIESKQIKQTKKSKKVSFQLNDTHRLNNLLQIRDYNNFIKVTGSTDLTICHPSSSNIFICIEIKTTIAHTSDIWKIILQVYTASLMQSTHATPVYGILSDMNNWYFVWLGPEKVIFEHRASFREALSIIWYLLNISDFTNTTLPSTELHRSLISAKNPFNNTNTRISDEVNNNNNNNNSNNNNNNNNLFGIIGKQNNNICEDTQSMFTYIYSGLRNKMPMDLRKSLDASMNMVVEEPSKTFEERILTEDNLLSENQLINYHIESL